MRGGRSSGSWWVVKEGEETEMVIREEICIGCGRCEPYCPVGAIAPTDEKTNRGKDRKRIDLAQCVECGACLRSQICPVDAIFQQPLEWPRTLRAAFSNPLTEHKSTGHMGRGTEEMKTNEITHRFVPGEVGVTLEMGRPGIGATLGEIEKMTRALAQWGVTFETDTPITSLMVDRKRGRFPKEVIGERVLSAIIEFKVPVEKLCSILPGLRELGERLTTVFSVGMISVLPEGRHDPIVDLLREAGVNLRPHGKVNLGLGRALP